VRVLDNFFSGRRTNLAAVRDEVEVIRGDCADASTARRAVRGVEVIFHEAAVPSVARSVADPALSHRANVDATLTMLLAARDAGVRRFIYAGSSSVYGDSPRLPKTEAMPTRPLSPYAVGKLTGEHYVGLFATLFGMETLTLRYFNVFGPRQTADSPYSGVIGRFATALLRGRRPVIYGDGRQSRDFTYVENVVEANRLALEAPRVRGEAINVASGRRVSLRHLLRAMAAIAGRPPVAIHRPARPGDVRHSLADIRLARRRLGYRPRVGLVAGLRPTMDWYRRALRGQS